LDKFEYSSKDIGVVISIKPKVVWESIADYIIVPNDGITIEIEESLSWVYWNGKQYIKFWGD